MKTISDALIPSVNAIIAAGFITAGIAYLISQWKQGGKSGKATTEQIEIYEGLNKALNVKVVDLNSRLNEAIDKIDVLEVKISKLTQASKHYENLIIRSLKEYWEAHPNEAKVYKQVKEYNNK